MRQTRLFIAAFIALLVLGVMSFYNISEVEAERGEDWTAEFYNCDDLDCDEEVEITYEDGINFDWGDDRPEDDDGDPIDEVDEDNFSIRFESDEDFDSGQYEFIITVNDGVRFYIDGDLVLDEWDDRDDEETFEFLYNVSEDRELELRVEYYDEEDDAVIQVEWFRQGDSTDDSDGVATPGPTATVGPTPTPIPPAQASVVRVNGLAIRTGPYLGATLVGVARPNTVYDVLAKNDSEGLFTWYLLRLGDVQGWSSGRYLELTVDPATIPSQGSLFDQIDGAPNTSVKGVPRAIMNFRVRPSTRTAITGKVGWGEEVDIIGRTIRGGENFWLHVRRADGSVGWIFAPYVTINGVIDAVPIR